MNIIARVSSYHRFCFTFLVHLSRRLKCTIVIMRCPSSVCRPSSVVVNFSHFHLLLYNRWTEFNETWQEARSQRPLPSLCFSERSEKQDGRPGLWLAETFSTSPLKRLNGIQRNLTGSKISTPSTKFVFFGPIRKTRWPPWPLIGWDIFDFSSETAERNSTKLDRKQNLNALYQVCVFRADLKNKMAALASDWLRHFRLLLWNQWREFNETWQEARSQRPLPSLCFSGRSEKQDGRPGLWLAETFSTSSLKPLNGIPRNLTGSKISTSSTRFVFFWADRKNKMAALVSDWLRHFRFILWNRWTEFHETWQEASSQRPLPSLCFSGRSEKQDGRRGLWLAETFSTSSLKPLNGIPRNLTGSKISTSSTRFVFFGPIGKTRWPLWCLIGWDIFVLSSETAEQNSTKLDRKQALSVLYQVCVFRADRKNKMAAEASDWLRHFRLLLWNRWTEFHETWQEARSQRPLLDLCFSGRSEKQDGCPDLWLAETFSTSPLKRLNGIQRNLTGRKLSTSSTKFVFFGSIGKTRWPPRPLIGWDIFDFFSETAEQNSTKLDRKQDLNVLYQICVFWADPKNKMAILASDWLRHFRLLLWNQWREFNETWQEARSQRPLPSLCFSSRSGKQDGRRGLWLAETFSTSSLKPLNRIPRNLTGARSQRPLPDLCFSDRSEQ